jgi:VWFA-related protein
MTMPGKNKFIQSIPSGIRAGTVVLLWSLLQPSAVLHGINRLIPLLQQKQEPLRHEVTVTLKLVQVYVTDKKGNPVQDLEQKDFIVFDNGKKQRVTEFERHILALPALAKAAQPEEAGKTPLPAARALMTRKFFLLFDFAYNNPKGILKAKEAALHFIDTKLQPTDELGVLSYSGLNSLSIVEFLTSDHHQAREVIAGIGLKQSAGRVENLQEKYYQEVTGTNPVDAGEWGKITLRKPENQLPDMGVKLDLEKDPTLRNWKFQEKGEFYALMFSEKMKVLAQALRYVPGQKHVVLFSSGVPYSLIYGIQAPYGDGRLGSWGDSLLKQRYEDMLQELSASNCIIYALNTEEIGASLRKDLGTMGVFSLQKMTSATGGKYFGNISDYEKDLEKIQNLTGCYYVVGYSIDDQWDGAYHKIRVEVNRPGCEVHAQKGYFNSKPFPKYSDLEKMLHLVDLALSEKPLSQTPAYFPLSALPWAAGQETALCLMTKIPKEKVPEILQGKAEVISLIFDQAENLIELRRTEETFSKFAEANIYYYSLLPLSPGSYKCRIVIRNLETGQGAVAASSSVIPEKQPKGFQLLPPLLLTQEENSRHLSGFVPEKISEKFESFSFPDFFHFNPGRYSPFLDDSLPANSPVPAILCCSTAGLADPEIQISASLVEKASGEATPLTLTIHSEVKEIEREILFVDIPVPQLPAGEYALNLIARDLKSQQESQVTKILQIK